MSTPTCTRCGRPLRDGLCPRGHPQRAARGRTRRERRWPRRLVLPVLILLLVATAIYAALWWYPERAAGELIEPASASFQGAATAYRDVVEAYPQGLVPENVAALASEELQAAAQARPALSGAQSELEALEPVGIPVIKGREPLGLATRTHGRMIAFTIGAQELVADVEAVSRFVSELVPLLPRARDLRQAIGEPSTPAEVDAALEAARPIAGQLLGDVEALTPPAELGSAHQALRAIAGRMSADLNELDRVSGRGAGPILNSLVQEIGRQLDTFSDTILGAPGEALEAGVDARTQELDKRLDRISRDLEDLSVVHGLPVTLPE
ncbi:MAG TPA: hypothetical protein VGB28_02725 [Actinomycetota bacterium]